MLSAICPLRVRLTRVLSPATLHFSERRYYRSTRPSRNSGDNRSPPPDSKQPTSNSTSSTSTSTNPPNKQQSSPPPSQSSQTKSLSPDNTKTDEIASEPDLTPEEEREELDELVDRVLNPGMADAAKHYIRTRNANTVNTIQKKGKWDNTQARIATDKILNQQRQDMLENKKRRDEDTVSDNPVSATIRNQKYKLGDATLSIEHADETILRKYKESVETVAGKQEEPLDRVEQEVFADDKPEIISSLLDRPSRVDKTIAESEGEEIVEFDGPEELHAAEEGQGKEAKGKPQTDRELMIKARQRGPAITKNEEGADALTLLYDEPPPPERTVIPYKDPLKQLKYLTVYPRTVRTWATYLRQCKGRYTKWGYWENDAKLQEQENILKDQLKARARKLGNTGIQIMIERRKRQILPLDLEGHYRFGVQPDELIGIHPKVKEMLSFKHANNSEIHAFRKQQHIKRWQERPLDHGTPQVQIACMTTRVKYLTEHMEKNKKDKQCKLQLRMLLSKRQALLRYLRKTNVPIYYQLVRELDIQDVSY